MFDARSPANGGPEHLLRWLDHELKDAPVELGSRVQVQDGTRAWRTETAWPPLDATPTTWYFGDGASLHADPTEADDGVYRTTPQPLFGYFIRDDVDLCPTCPTFLTEPFEETVRIAGSPRIHTTIVPHAPSGEITAKLFAVAPDGNHRQIGWSHMDLRFHEGGEQMHTVVPEQPIVARMQAQILDDVIPEGHRLAVTLAQAEAGDRSEEPVNAPVDWIVGGEASRIIVDAVEPDPETYFQPPCDS